MENNDGNIKSQQTGGLKLMTVFIAVLALHVVVIGGFTVYHLMSGGGADVDITLDKTHKDAKPDSTAMADGSTPDVNKPASTDSASAPASTASTPDTTSSSDATSAPIQPPVQKPAAPVATTTTPAPVMTAPTPSVVTTTSPAPVTPTPAPVAPTPAPIAHTPSTAMTMTPSVPPSAISSLAPPPEPTLSLAAPAPMNTAPLATAPIDSEPVASGPVHMPKKTSASPAHEVASSHEAASSHASEAVAKKEFYTVKITDSYKKIAKAHNITVAELKEVNHIKDNTLHSGQKLIIPLSRTSVAKTGSGSTTNLAASGTVSHHHYYTVEKGDTLAYIAHKFNTTKAAILAINDINTSARLTVGTKLKIPASKETRSAGTAVPKTRPVQVQAQQSTPVAQPQAPQPVATQPAPSQTVATPELANMTF